MRMSNVGLLAMVCFGLTAVGWAAANSASEAAQEYLAQQEERSQHYDYERVMRDTFADFMERIHGQLEKGKISLPQASAEVLTYCRQCYPIYLSHLRFVENGSNWTEKVAQNLVRYFQTPPQSRPDRFSPELVARLVTELHQFQREVQAAPPAETSPEGPFYSFQ